MSGNFRSEARSVRAAAQAKLSELRAQRRETRAASQPKAKEAASSVVEAAPKPKKLTKAPTRKAAPPAATSNSTEESAPPKPKGQEIQVSAAAQSLSSKAVDEPTAKSRSKSAAAKSKAKTAPRPRKSAPAKLAKANKAEAKLAQNDLKTLPGVGDGLVRLFETCGVYSLSDLAKADATDLRGKMGLPGELLNIESWVVSAQAATAASASSLDDDKADGA